MAVEEVFVPVLAMLGVHVLNINAHEGREKLSYKQND
jgi:hypothetical protein